MPKFNIISQFLKDISFESPNVPELFFKQDSNPAKLEMNIDINVKGAENNLYMIDLITRVHSKLEKEDKTVFLIESTYSGLVQCEEKDDDTKRKLFFIDVPTLLLPYVRSLVTRLTAESGFPPFTMPLVDFAQLYEQRQQQAAKQSAEQKPANQ